MIELRTVFAILFLHLVGDFFMQTNKMAINKSSSNYWLTVHVSLYMIPFAIWCLLFFSTLDGLIFVLVNFVAHWITDYFTSRLTAYLYKKERRHDFFVAIGCDQVVHYTCLILTFNYLLK